MQIFTWINRENEKAGFPLVITETSESHIVGRRVHRLFKQDL